MGNVSRFSTQIAHRTPFRDGTLTITGMASALIWPETQELELFSVLWIYLALLERRLRASPRLVSILTQLHPIVGGNVRLPRMLPCSFRNRVGCIRLPWGPRLSFDMTYKPPHCGKLAKIGVAYQFSLRGISAIRL